MSIMTAAVQVQTLYKTRASKYVGGKSQAVKVPSGEKHVPSQNKRHWALTNRPNVLPLQVESEHPSQGSPAAASTLMMPHGN